MGSIYGEGKAWIATIKHSYGDTSAWNEIRVFQLIEIYILGYKGVQHIPPHSVMIVYGSKNA